jgi:hypothetical protein
MALALCLVALILAGVRLVQSKGNDLIAWAVACLGVSLLWGRF